MRLRLLLSTFVAVLPVLALGGSPASAQASTCPPPAGAGTAGYPPSTGTLAVSNSEVTPGQPVTVSGGGFPSNATVTLLFDGTQVGTAQPNAACVLSATVTVPANAAPGVHTITARGGGRELSTTVRVLGVQVDRAAGGGLPRTGSSSSVPTGIAGVVLVGVGSLAVIAARRRRTA